VALSDGVFVLLFLSGDGRATHCCDMTPCAVGGGTFAIPPDWILSTNCVTLATAWGIYGGRPAVGGGGGRDWGWSCDFPWG
jgi:hypothetical protein